MNIVEFLEARIAEDEAYARQAQGDKYGWVDRWRVATGHGAATESVITAHAFRLSPDRMLAECAAKREIIDTYRSAVRHEAGADVSTELSGKLTLSGIAQGLEIAIQYMATTYKDHPDYRREWAE